MIQIILYIIIGFIMGFLLAFIYNKHKASNTNPTQLPEYIAILQDLESQKIEKAALLATSKQMSIELQNTKTEENHLKEKNQNLISQNATLLSENNQAQQQNKELLNRNKQQIQENAENTQKIQKLTMDLEKVKIEKDNVLQQHHLTNTSLQETKKEILTLNQNKLELERNKTQLSALNNALEQQLSNQKTEFIEIQEKAKLEIKQMVEGIAEQKSKSFDTNSKQLMESVLTPLKENLISFKKTVDNTYINESKERAIIQDRIRELVEKTNEVSEQANNLTTALKGQSKTQGDWGEMILESILQKSGLTKDREYTIQENIINTLGNNQRPDVLIKLPDNRVIIVDSKVSLNAYERYVSASEAQSQELELKNHVSAIKNHINQLSSKKYDDLNDALDFTMMFLPIEPAYILAIQYDPELWNYAYQKRILLVSPTNLMACVKLFSDLWKREHQNQNALEIANKAGALYDKFIGFIEDLDKVTNHLDRASTAHNEAIKKLSTGNGNLIKRAETLKKLGIKTNKSVASKFIE